MDACWDLCSLNDVAQLECFVCIFRGLLNVAVRIAGLVLIVMFLVGGFNWIFAGGDAKKAAQAWNALTYAVLGLVLIILGWFLLLFIERFTGLTDILRFRIGTP